jgi:FkbM family methyltransferase
MERLYFHHSDGPQFLSLAEILVHRLRDFDAAFRSASRLRLLLYVFLRQLSKVVKVDENKIIELIPETSMSLFGYRFLTRRRTLDFLFFSRFYEFQTTALIRSIRGDVFLDVGAHLGRFSIVSSESFRRIYSIEPHPSNFRYLVRNIRLNGLSNITPVQNAMSNRDASVNVSRLAPNTGAVKIAKTGTKVPSRRLDSLIGYLRIPFDNITLIKIDVEGHEMEVLKGSTNLLKYGSPRIVVESFTLGKVRRLLERFGYWYSGTFDFYNHLFLKNGTLSRS